MRRNLVVRGDQRSKAVRLGLSHNQAVERIASPRLVQGRIDNFREIQGADLETHLMFELAENVSGTYVSAIDLMEEFQFQQHDWRQ